MVPNQDLDSIHAYLSDCGDSLCASPSIIHPKMCLPPSLDTDFCHPNLESAPFKQPGHLIGK